MADTHSEVQGILLNARVLADRRVPELVCRAVVSAANGLYGTAGGACGTGYLWRLGPGSSFAGEPVLASAGQHASLGRSIRIAVTTGPVKPWSFPGFAQRR